MSAITVRLIIDAVNRQWILGKMAARLAAGLSAHGVTAEVGEEPRDNVDVNHWMLYLQPWRHYYSAPGFYTRHWRPAPTFHTAMITHVDDPLKVHILKESLSKIVDMGICMSRMTKAELIGHGFDAGRLTYINPGHDGAIQPRRITIGITSRLYKDARKGERDLLRLSRSMSLDAFRFDITGQGWEAVAAVLQEAGAEVDLSAADGDYDQILSRIPSFDYYLYLGWDEGSMGTLDALAAGVKTIITPQGFHLDLKGGITHPVRDAADLIKVFQSIREDRQRRLDGVRNLTWDEYARKHVAVWRALIDGRQSEVQALVGEESLQAEYAVRDSDVSASRSRLCRRSFKSEFWPFFIESRRFWARGKLSAAKRFILRRARR